MAARSPGRSRTQDPRKRGLGPGAPEMAPGHPQAPVREGGPGFVPELRGSTFSGLSRAWGREQRWPWPGLGGGGPLCVQCNYQDPEMGAWPRGQWNHAGTLRRRLQSSAIQRMSPVGSRHPTCPWSASVKAEVIDGTGSPCWGVPGDPPAEATALWCVTFAPHSAFWVLGHFWDFLQQKQMKQATKLCMTGYSRCRDWPRPGRPAGQLVLIPL